MAVWYQPPPTLNLISPTLKLNSLRCTCSYNLSILNSKPTHIPKLEPKPIFASVKTFVPTTVANLGLGFDFLSCIVDGLRDFISLSIDSSVHPSKISITKISGNATRKINLDPLSNCVGIAVIEVMKMLKIRPVGLSLFLEKGLPVAKPRTSASTISIKNQISLEATAIVGKLSDMVQAQINNLPAN
ncbi:hypothetical protein CMV_030560 [Castanea mollissima]|uniref:Homoserine kinase n=1 Tax=Castanea mollissima TaxID=60419 RepID=A0A8J4Q5Y1_9ROSI|nr:hypothetical protein CMV_030560 [Castanea mollissima]